MRHEQNEMALESVRHAYAFLRALPTILSSDAEDDWMAWYVHAWVEVTGYMISLASGPGHLLASLLHNREAIGVLQAVIDGQERLRNWLLQRPSLLEAQLRTFADRVELLLRLAEDGFTAEEEDQLASAGDVSSLFLGTQECENALDAALKLCRDTIRSAQSTVDQASQQRGGRKHLMVTVPQLFTTLGRLFRIQAKTQEAFGDRPAALQSYRTAIGIFREVVCFDCPSALEQLLACYIEWVPLEGLNKQFANGDHPFIKACIQLNIMHQKLGRQIATAEVWRCAETFDAWIEACGINAQLGEKFCNDWAATCHTLKRHRRKRDDS